MDTTLFLALLAIILLSIVAFVAWRRWRSRRALMRQVRELQSLAETCRALEIMDTSTFQLGLFDGPRYNIRLWIRDGQRMPSQSFDLSDNPGLIGWVQQ